MKYINIGNGEIKASAIALGCMRIADKSVKEVAELINTALEEGINFLTMLIYMAVANLKKFC